MMDLARTLGYNYVFRGLSPQVVAGLAALAEIREVRGGEVLVRQFERDSDLIVFLEGEGLIKSFNEEILAEVGPGSVVGEMSLIDEMPRSATVVSKGAAKIAVIDSRALRGMLETSPQTASIVLGNLCKVLCRRLRAMNVQVDAMGGE